MAKTFAAMTDEELDAAATETMEARAADEAKHKERLHAIGDERDRRVALVRAEELKRQLDELPEDVRAEVIGG